jgi:hypothetical protein
MANVQDYEKKIKSGEMKLSDVPAGYKKKEIKAKKIDEAQEAGEKMTQNLGKIPEKALQPEREIQYGIRKNFLDIRVPGCRVKWVNYVHQHGTAVWEARGQGWIIVTKDMVVPEDRDMCREDNTFKIGDVMAVCMPLQRYGELLAAQAMKTARVEQTEDVAELHDLRKKHPKAFKILDDLSNDPETLSVIRKQLGDPVTKHGAKRVAARHLGEKMKQGMVPGIPLT